MQAIVKIVKEDSPERTPTRTKGRSSAYIKNSDDEREVTSLRLISNAASLLEGAEKKDIDSKSHCTLCRELQHPVTIYCSYGKLMPNLQQ